jgi:hypothetical protein
MVAGHNQCVTDKDQPWCDMLRVYSEIRNLRGISGLEPRLLFATVNGTGVVIQLNTPLIKGIVAGDTGVNTLTWAGWIRLSYLAQMAWRYQLFCSR